MPAWVAGYSPEIITRAEAERYPDFGQGSKVDYFGGTTLDYLSGNLSGFNLQWSGGVLVCAALVLLAVRPRNARLLRTEVWAMAGASLLLWALAQAVLFHLYLPQRYTYALVPFCAILIAVAWRPTWESLARHRPSPLALGRARGAGGPPPRLPRPHRLPARPAALAGRGPRDLRGSTSGGSSARS